MLLHLNHTSAVYVMVHTVPSTAPRQLERNICAGCGKPDKVRITWAADPFYPVSSDRTCGNCPKLCRGRFRLDIRQHVFTKRVVRHWHRLPRAVVDAPSLSVKRRLDTALNNTL